ncbi:Pheromone-processing carboxypeptidase KEX1 [Labeo rohita]|uniref:Pheromone-processing carboxypeptidase KEX1 n=1 Tax=Labeo rohita TaxID=84645 RepID=A0ABQ8LVQ2_LABRO|nr:Pheromone-processing carboxypeptidase KEX1 [Labeo rohita]
MDVNTPEDSLIHKRVCGDHFYDEDYHHSDKGHRRLLKSSAVPITFLRQAEPDEKPESLATHSEAELEVQGAGAFWTNAPQSTPVKNTTRQFTEAYSKFLVIRSPETAQKGTNTSTSGTYYAFPPVRSHQSPPMYIKPEQTEDQYEENVKPDVSMLPIDPSSDKKDVRVQPLSSTSASSTEDEECEKNLKTTLWIVNEPSLMELFKRCQECGSLITETRKATVGSLLRFDECLLIAVLFLHAHYSLEHSMLNLQIPKKTTYHAIQSSYLLYLIITELYQEQQKTAVNDLHDQNELQNPVQLSGDGRSDRQQFLDCMWVERQA